MNGISSWGNEFVSKDGQCDSTTLNAVELIGIYFSAHWCPPCRNFTPVLAEFYNQVNANGKVMEIVFCTADQDDHQFKEYLATMPWIALPFGSGVIESLNETHKVSGIPRLVIIKPDGTVVKSDARGEVTNIGPSIFAKWAAGGSSLKIIDPNWVAELEAGKTVKHT